MKAIEFIRKAKCEVLAKRTKYGLMTVTFANRTQADNKLTQLRRLGYIVDMTASHPFLIIKQIY